MNIRLLIGLFSCASAIGFAADPVTLTLPEAVKLALAQNRELKIARLKVREQEQKKAGVKADYFPQLKNESTFLHVTALENIVIPEGAFGALPNAGFVPTHDVLIGQGSQTVETIGTGLTQPLTPLIRVRQQNRIAASEVLASRDDVKKAENQIAVKVHEAYYGILIARLQKLAADQNNEYRENALARIPGRCARRQCAESRRARQPGQPSSKRAVCFDH